MNKVIFKHFVVIRTAYRNENKLVRNNLCAGEIFHEINIHLENRSV